MAPYWLLANCRLIQSQPNNLSKYTGRIINLLRETSGGINSITLELLGRLIMCKGYNRRVTRRELEGTILVLDSHWNGKLLHRPNTVVGKSDEIIYFRTPGNRIDPSEINTFQ